MKHRTILTIVEPLLAVVTFIEQVNDFVKLACGVSTLVVAFFAIRAYSIKYKIDQTQLRIDQAKLAKMEAEYLDRYKSKMLDS